MKTNFWKFAAAFVVGLSAAVACQKDSEPEKIAPVFPSEVIEQNVEAGATVEVTFDANQDWELSIPAAEQNKYWLDDAGVPASKVTGKAGAQTVSVVFSEDQYYDANVLCEVTLSMGGQSKVIAKFTRLAINRTLEVYTAETSEWGFKNTYTAEKATALALTTFEGDVTYTQRIKVLANFNWNLSLPEWCEGQIKVAAGETAPESLSGTAGQAVEIELVGKLTAAVKAGASDFARFIDAADNTKSEQLALTLPAFENRLEVTDPNTMEFSADGSADGMAVGYVLGMDGFVVRALEWDAEGGYHICHSYANWVTAEFAGASEGEEIFVQKSFTLGVEVNNGAARCADIFVFPASMAETASLSICVETDPNCGIKPEYKEYCVGRLTQKGETLPFITLYNNMEDEYDQYNPWQATLEPAADASWWHYDIHESIANLGTNNKLTLTYSHPDAFAALQFAGEYASYKIYDYDTNEVAENDEENFWMTYLFMSGNGMGRISMNPESFVAPDLDGNGAPDSIDPESYIVFFDADGNALAAVQCKYSSAPSGGNASEIITVKSGMAEITSDMSMIGGSGLLKNIVANAFGMMPENEYMIMPSTPEVVYSTSFDTMQVFALGFDGSPINPEGFSWRVSGPKEVAVSVARNTECILLFMDGAGNIPVVAYYSYY